MTMFGNEPILLMFAGVFFLYFIALSVRFPMILSAIYPFTFLFFTQTMFSIGGISPSKYLGAVLILVGVIYFIKEVLSKEKKQYSLGGLFCLMMLFPIWILIRFLVEGSDLSLAFTFMLNALTTFSIVVIVNTKRRKKIMEISLGATFAILSLGMIAARYFPSLSFLRSLQQGDYSRTLGLVNDPNYGGAFIAISFAYFFSKAVSYYDRKRMKLFHLSLVFIVISTVSLLLTVSRAAILSVVICVLMTAFYGRIKFKNILWFLPSLVALFVVFRNFPDVIDAVLYRLSITRLDPSNLARLEFFRSGISVIRNNLLWGVGDFSGYHNAFLDVTVFGGIFALVFFLLLTFVVFKMNTKIMALSEGSFRDDARFVILGLIVFLFNSLFIGMETERITWFLFGWGMINFVLFRNTVPNEISSEKNYLRSRVSQDQRVVVI